MADEQSPVVTGDADERIGEQTVQPMLGTITLDVTDAGARVRLTKPQVETLQKANVILVTIDRHATGKTHDAANTVVGGMSNPLRTIIDAYREG